MFWRRLFQGKRDAVETRADGESEISRLRSERDTLLEILDHMPEGVAVTGANGDILLTNPPFEEMFRRDAAADETESGPPTLPRDLLRDLVAQTVGEAGSPSREVLWHSPDRHLSLVASELPSEKGVVVVARDVSETIQSTEARRDLVANVSHELKTPLTAIRGYAETLRDGALEEPGIAHRFTVQILAQCGRLEALLGDLLTLSRIESQPPPTDARETVDLGLLVTDVTEVLESRARGREIRLDVFLPEAPPRVHGDRAELERLFLNLLENAIKYNRHGGEIHVALRSDGDNARVTVRDTGIGIPPEVKDRIFERFYRVDKGRARDEGGTGLGLAIVKHAVRRHGGSVHVESTLGKGSTFEVRLPLVSD